MSFKPEVGTKCRFYDNPKYVKPEDLKYWKTDDVLEVFGYRHCNGTEVAIVWNEQDQTASSLVLDYLMPLDSDYE